LKTLTNFKNLLPQNGSFVTPASANAGPLENRLDIIYLDTLIGALNKLVDNHSVTFSSKDVFIIVNSSLPTIVMYLNSLKADIGNKFQADVVDQLSITNEINELDYKIYTSEKLVNILSRYELNTRGNYIKTGCECSIEKVTIPLNGINTNLSKITTISTNYDMYLYNLIVTSNFSINTVLELFYNYKNIKDTLINRSTPVNLTNKKIIELNINPGNIMIDGHIMNIRKKRMKLPYTNDIDINYPQKRIDTLSFNYYDGTDEELFLLWNSTLTYNIADIVYSNNYLYISRIDNNINNPVNDVNNWHKLIYTDNLQRKRVIALYNTGVSNLNGIFQGVNSYTSVPVNIDSNNVMPFAYIYNDDLTPNIAQYSKRNIVIKNIDTIRNVSAKDINTIDNKSKDIDYNINTLEASILTNINNGSALTGMTRNSFVEPFIDDSNRDTELEKIESNSFCTTVNGSLEIGSQWDSYSIPITTELVLPITNEVNMINQDKFTKSRLINQFKVNGYSELPFKINNNIERFIASHVYTEKVNTNNVNTWWWGRSSSTSSVKTLGNSFIDLPSNGMYTKGTSTTINISLGNYSFNSNEKILLNVGDVYSTTVYSDINGAINRTIVVPANVLRNMKYNVTLVGEKSHVRALSSINIVAVKETTNRLRTITNYIIDWLWWDWQGDPLALTFKSTSDCTLSSIDVIFDLINDHGAELPNGTAFALPDNIKIKVTETTAGYPNSDKLIGTAMAKINTPVNNMSPVKIYFNNRIKLKKDVLYGVYFICNSTITARIVDTNPSLARFGGYRMQMRSAKLGERNINPNSSTFNNIVNQQPYIDGIVLNSSNNNTWSPIQDEDLYFKINKAVYNPLLIDTRSVNVNAAKTYTDIGISINDIIDQDTNIKYKYSINGTESSISNNSISHINTNINTLDIISTLSTSNTSISPVIRAMNVQLGVLNNKGIYITKNLNINKANYPVQKDLLIYIDAVEYWNTALIKIYYTTDVLISNSSWIEVPYIQDGFSGTYQEKVYKSTGIRVYDTFRLKIELYKDTSNVNNRIKIANMRCTLK